MSWQTVNRRDGRTHHGTDSAGPVRRFVRPAAPGGCQTWELDAVPAGWVVPAGADAGWVVDGGRLRAAPITDDQTAAIGFSFNCAGDNLLSVHYGVSSEEGWDFFVVLVDGVEVFSDSGDKPSGEVFSYPVADGSHTVEFRYVKDEIYSDFNDTAYLYLVEVCPYVPPPPAHLVALDYSSETLYWLNADGTVTGSVEQALAGHRDNTLRLGEEAVFVAGTSKDSWMSALVVYTPYPALRLPERATDAPWAVNNWSVWGFELLPGRYAVYIRSTGEGVYVHDRQTDALLWSVAGAYQYPIFGPDGEMILAYGDSSQTSFEKRDADGAVLSFPVTVPDRWLVSVRRAAPTAHFYLFQNDTLVM